MTDELTFYNSPPVNVNNILGQKILIGRAVYRNGKLDTTSFVQSLKYSNVFNKRNVLIKGTPRSKEIDFDEGGQILKFEIEFANGTKHIINFNENYLKYQHDCISKNRF